MCYLFFLQTIKIGEALHETLQSTHISSLDTWKVISLVQITSGWKNNVNLWHKLCSHCAKKRLNWTLYNVITFVFWWENRKNYLNAWNWPAELWRAVGGDAEEKLLQIDGEAEHLFAAWLRLKIIMWLLETSVEGKVKLYRSWRIDWRWLSH